MSLLFLLNLTQDLVAEFLDGRRKFFLCRLFRVILHPHTVLSSRDIFRSLTPFSNGMFS